MGEGRVRERADLSAAIRSGRYISAHKPCAGGMEAGGSLKLPG